MTRGVLYVVATPIGNLEDITIRALDVLQRVHVIACEDTRTTRVLLRKWDINTRTMSLHRFSEARKADKIMDLLNSGLDVALVSDAGTPAVSDPGSRVVRVVLDAGITVTPIPGPSSVVAAVSVSGMDGSAFVYHGFAPKKDEERRQFFERIQADTRTSVFFETAVRIRSCLRIAADVLAARRMVLFRELTKIHEETLIGAAAEVLSELERRPSVKGEIVIVVEGATDRRPASDLTNVVKTLMGEGLSGKRLAAAAHERFGLKKGDAYRRFLELTGKGASEGPADDRGNREF
ncbi:MAG: 16S rRNA (cytidine(1402)-2'-O)-methyltransferase [Desulfomonile sp.]|nr:16S rRNA (cytidine(1402)-2'-O)-methyltransferase [Desulfomonile sp.]